MNRELSVQGIGVVTDSITDVSALITTRSDLPAFEVLKPAAVESHDALTQLAIRAIHQAWTMARVQADEGERVGLIFQSMWGMIDATAAYLESMLAEGGKYASPRHFSRSVYSSVASVAAIHFGIKGPCETMVYESERLVGPLCQAWRLLRAQRCDRVIVAWGEQGGEVAEDLTKRAAEKLRRQEFRRYVDRGVGSGAVAIAVGADGKLGKMNIGQLSKFENAEQKDYKPFEMDAGVELVKHLLSGAAT